MKAKFEIFFNKINYVTCITVEDLICEKIEIPLMRLFKNRVEDDSDILTPFQIINIYKDLIVYLYKTDYDKIPQSYIDILGELRCVMGCRGIAI